MVWFNVQIKLKMNDGYIIPHSGPALNHNEREKSSQWLEIKWYIWSPTLGGRKSDLR